MRFCPIFFLTLVSFFGVLLSAGCSETRRPAGDVDENRLPPCPDRPNCVCSDARDERRGIEPYAITASPQKAWKALHDVLGSLPRVRIVRSTETHVHAEARSLVFRFIDDVDFQLRPEQRTIAVRSASRVGYADFGVNRRRIEHIRQLLRERGVVR